MLPSIYASAPFKFIVGGNAFYVHAELVSGHSRPLGRMINGERSEAQQGFAILRDLDESTFVRFVEWAYQGYYTSGECACRPSSTAKSESNLSRTDIPPAEAPVAEEPVMESAIDAEQMDNEQVNWQWSFDDSRPKRKKGKQNPSNVDFLGKPVTQPLRRQLRETFFQRKATVRKESIIIPPPRRNQDPNEDYTDVFLSHAKLYVFADMYAIEALKVLALENLHSVLAIFDLYDECTPDIIALLQYAYANTKAMVGYTDNMRVLLADYIGCEMDTLIKDESFRDLMIEEGGALLGDFLRMVQKRID